MRSATKLPPGGLLRRLGLGIAFLAGVVLLPGSASAVVSRIALESNRMTTVPGIPATVTAKAFDPADAPESVFGVNFSLVEGAAGGSLGPNVDCAGEPAGSLHCVVYTPPASDGTYHVHAVLATDPAITAEVAVQVVHCAPYPADGGDLTCTGSITPAFDHRGDLKVAVILLEPQDFLSADAVERDRFRADIIDRFYGPGSSVQHWLQENGLGAVHLTGGAMDVYGPYPMAHNWGDYFQANGQLQWGTGQGICFQEEGVALADPDLDYSQYNRVFFVVKGDASHNVWGWTNGVWNSRMADGCITVAASRAGSQSDWRVNSHEFMHTLVMTQGMSWTPDLYGGAAPNRVGTWDIMGNHTAGSQNTMPIKWAGEWLPAADVRELPRPVGTAEVNETVVIGPAEVPETDPAIFKTVKIPITDRKFLFVENRAAIAGNISDQALPANGIIVTDWTPNPGLLGEDRAPILLAGGPLSTTGEEFVQADPVDPTRRLSVTLTGASGDNRTVNIRWRQFRPDPFIRPWEPPPYESVDIFNDCPLNNEGGMVRYADHDTSGNPQGSGDPPCFGVTNTLSARIHNGGNAEASGVQVSFYWIDPSIGDPPWNFIGTSPPVTIPPDGSEMVVSVPWIPLRDPAHVCVKVSINIVPGELNPANNLAQENFNVQESPSGSPYHPATMKVNVNNPFDEPSFVRLGFWELPEGWTLRISKRYVYLLPHETKPVEVTITPPVALQDRKAVALVSIGGFAYREAPDLREEEMRHIGGVSIVTRGVQPVPQMQLSVAPASIPLGSTVTAEIFAHPLVGELVAVVFHGPGGEEEIRLGRTDVNRRLRLDFVPPAVGAWTAIARFMGTERSAAAASNEVAFTVGGGGSAAPPAGRAFVAGYFMGGLLFDDGFRFDRDLLYGFRLGRELPRDLQAEGEILFSSLFDNRERHGFLANASLLVSKGFATSGRIDPFVEAGLGYYDFGQFSPAVDASGLGGFVGAGLKLRFRPSLLGRVEARWLDLFGLDLEDERHTSILWGLDVRF